MFLFIQVVTALDLKWIFSTLTLKKGTFPINNHTVYYRDETESLRECSNGKHDCAMGVKCFCRYMFLAQASFLLKKAFTFLPLFSFYLLSSTEGL